MQSTSPVLRHSIAIRTTQPKIPSWPATFRAQCLECGWSSPAYESRLNAVHMGEDHQAQMAVVVHAQPGAATATGGGTASGEPLGLWREDRVPEWRQVIDTLRAAGYDTGQWQVEIGRHFREYFTKMAEDLLDDMDIDPIGEYHNDAQRRALVEIMTQVAARALQASTVRVDPRTIDLSSVLTNKRFKQLFEGIE